MRQLSVEWQQFTRECFEADSYSRKLSRRVCESHASKRRRPGVLEAAGRARYKA
jgi:hypothetical protein